MKVTHLLSGLAMSVCLLLGIPLQAQVTITAGTKWQDVMLVQSLKPGEENAATYAFSIA